MAGDKRSFLSKEDLTGKISKTVFVTNFPDHITARDLWNVCTAYGKVVDVYIPLKRSKTGKKFAFVRFLKVDNMERLIENLCTIWIGHFHLHANPVRFQRESMASFVQPSKGSPSSDSSPTIVMDDSCIVDNDLSCSLMGKIKDINALSNNYRKCSIIEGLASWFSELCIADPSFVSEDRLVWISIKGLPFNTWNNNAYAKIIILVGTFSLMGRTTPDSSSSAKQIYVVTKVHTIIKNQNHRKRKKEQGNSTTKIGRESEDPFGIYSILKRNNQKEKSKDAGKSDPSFPPGFTPKGVNETIEEEENGTIWKDVPKIKKLWLTQSEWNIGSENEILCTIYNDIGAKKGETFNHYYPTSCLNDPSLEWEIPLYMGSKTQCSKMEYNGKILISEGLELYFFRLRKENCCYIEGGFKACLSSAMGSILVNGSPSSEFKFHKDGGALDNTGKFARSFIWTTIVRECGNFSSKGLDVVDGLDGTERGYLGL
ncbi:RNA-directed DNA polymerase, eukaryota [Tanacetum coccineum]